MKNTEKTSESLKATSHIGGEIDSNRLSKMLNPELTSELLRATSHIGGEIDSNRLSKMLNPELTSELLDAMSPIEYEIIENGDGSISLFFTKKEKKLGISILPEGGYKVLKGTDPKYSLDQLNKIKDFIYKEL